MFEESFIRPEEDFKMKALIFPVSLLIHAFIITLLIALPLAKTGPLPKIGPPDIIPAYIYSTPPAPPAGNPDKSGKKTKIKSLPKESLSGLSGFMAPRDIPDKIIDEPLMDIGSGWGVPGGRTDSEADEDLNVFQSDLFRGVFGKDDDDVKDPVRPHMEIKAPRLIKHVDPLYPEIARQARVEGIVVIEATTDIYGRVQNVRILRSVPLLDQAAVDAVRQWIYEPMVINGRPRGVIFTVTVRFQLR